MNLRGFPQPSYSLDEMLISMVNVDNAESPRSSFTACRCLSCLQIPHKEAGAGCNRIILKMRVNLDKSSRTTYNARDSLAVADSTTSLAPAGLSMGEETGSLVLR